MGLKGGQDEVSKDDLGLRKYCSVQAANQSQYFKKLSKSIKGNIKSSLTPQL